MISYEPLFKTMKQKNITPYRLFKEGFQPSTFYNRIKKGKGITMRTVDKLCSICDCSVDEVFEYIPDHE